MTLLTIHEAAEALRLSDNTVYALCKARKLRHERHGLGRGKILIPADALVEYRRGVTVESEQEPEKAPARMKMPLKHLSP